MQIGCIVSVALVTLHNGKPMRGGKANLWLEQSWNLKGNQLLGDVRGERCKVLLVVRMDQHSSVETLLSKAEIPIIDLSHMGE